MTKFVLLIIIATHIFILSKLIFFPYPELFIYPYLTNHGLKPYSQILDQHFPGLMFLPINFDNLGMNDAQTARIWLYAIVAITHLLIFLISKKILGEKKALLVNFLYLLWQPFFEGWVLWIDTFLPLFLLPAYYFLYKKNFFLSGIFLGIAIVFKQVLIPLSLLVLIYIFWESKDTKKVVRYLFGLLSPIIMMALYLSSIGVIKDFWYWTVIFNLTTYAQFGRGAGPTLAHFSRVLLVFGSALLIFNKIKSHEAQILLIFLIGALIGLSTRFDFVHFQPALPFAILATVLGLGSLRKLGRLGFLSIYGIILIWWIIIFYKGHLGDRVISFDSNTEELAIKIRDYTSSGEKIFVFGAVPHLYQMSRTLPAGDIFVFQFPWFLKVSQNRILEGIKKDEPEIIVSDRTVIIEGVKIIDFASEIDQYISENYEKIDSVGKTDILYKVK